MPRNSRPAGRPAGRRRAVRPRTFRVLLVVAVVVLITLPVLARTFVAPSDDQLPVALYVDARDGDDAQQGTGPDTALATLGAALRRAPDVDEIRVKGYPDTFYAEDFSACYPLGRRQDGPLIIRPYDVEVGGKRVRPIFAGGVRVLGQWREIAPETWQAPRPAVLPAEEPRVLFVSDLGPLTRVATEAALARRPGTFLLTDRRVAVHGLPEGAEPGTGPQSYTMVLPGGVGPCLVPGDRPVTVEGLRLRYYRDALRLGDDTSPSSVGVVLRELDASFNTGRGYTLGLTGSRVTDLSGRQNGRGLLLLRPGSSGNVLTDLTARQRGGTAVTVRGPDSTDNRVSQLVLVTLDGRPPTAVRQVAGATGTTVSGLRRR